MEANFKGLRESCITLCEEMWMNIAEGKFMCNACICDFEEEI